MNSTVKNTCMALAVGALLATSGSALAQGFGGGRGGQGGGFDPEAMRQRMMERYQTELEATDDEWKVIQPLLTDVMEKQRATAGRRFGGMMFGRRGPQQGQDAQANQRGGRGNRPGFGEPDPAMEALQTALEDENTSKTDLKAKLTALRDSRKKAEAELKASRDKLRQVLTLRQEAKLVMAGMLD